MRIYLSMEQDR